MKLLLWCWVGVGLLPCIYLAVGGGRMFQQMLALKRRLPQFNGVIWHDEYFRIEFSGWKLELFPRLWAFALLGMGIIAIMTSLVFLLHIPTPRASEHATDGLTQFSN